jgi:putative transposase
MTLPRSTYYDAPAEPIGDAEILCRVETICDEFEAYGYRRVGAELRHQGIIVNAKKIRRLMREHDLQPKRRRRYVATTDSDHDNPIFPNRARGMIVDGANQLWVADLTYIAIATGFVYLAAILDAWSRRVVGYAISRSIDARLTVAALKAAIHVRKPPAGCVHHSDRGSQGEFKRSSQHPNGGGCDEQTEAALGSCRTSAFVLAGKTVNCRARRTGTLLDGDCGRLIE